MKQWIIDRYNKGQDKYKFENRNDCYYAISVAHRDEWTSIHLYDFLFNPKWGFAKAFWGDDWLKNTGLFYYKDDFEEEYEMPGDKYHLQQLAIAPDPLEYLEQFSDRKEG